MKYLVTCLAKKCIKQKYIKLDAIQSGSFQKIQGFIKFLILQQNLVKQKLKYQRHKVQKLIKKW